MSKFLVPVLIAVVGSVIASAIFTLWVAPRLGAGKTAQIYALKNNAA